VRVRQPRPGYVGLTAVAEMRTTDRAVLTVVHANGLHVRTAYPVYQRFQAAMAALQESKRAGVVRTSVDLIRDYKGPRTIRVWV
jgi:hypothetical protein